MTDDERKEIVQLRLDNAAEAIKAAEILCENALWSAAINRMYYACYYAVTALLVNGGIEASSHAGVRQMLNLHFVKEGKLSRTKAAFYSDLFAKRHSGDYDDFIIFDKQTVESLMPEVYEFVKTIKELIPGRK